MNENKPTNKGVTSNENKPTNKGVTSMDSNITQEEELKQENLENNFQITHTRHYFNDVLASQIGVLEAIMVNHFIYWITINKRNKRNFHDGRTWSYISFDEISKHFIYLTKDQVRDILYKLVNGKNRKSKKKQSFKPILKTGNYNKSKFDKTTWYAFEDEGLFIKEKTPAGDVGKSPNGKGQIPTPIPDNKTDNKKSTNVDTKKIQYSENIKMTERDYNKLIEKFGKEKVETAMEEYDRWKHNNGIERCDDYKGTRNWIKRDNAQSEKKKGALEKTKAMNIRWLDDKIKALTYSNMRGNLSYNREEAYDSILNVRTSLKSPKMIDVVKGWDKMRRKI